MKHLDGLNPGQKEAVTHMDGPLLVLAGAGAGKTRVITHRILNLIRKGVSPQSILAVTFTNKAAKEMRERVITLIEENDEVNRPTREMSVPYVSTFHALGVEILRENFRILGVTKYFTIFDRSDSIKAIRVSIKEAGYDTSQFEPKKILGSISKQKGDGVSLEEYEATVQNEYFGNIVAECWSRYEKILKKEGAYDFDDLLLKTAKLLRENESIRKNYQNIWRYIHIDEYQDTNKVQNEITKLLAGERNNICVVGDIDQCIIGGTKITMASGPNKNIEDIREGDEVLSNYGSGDTRKAIVTRTNNRLYSGDLITIHTKKGYQLTTTSEHTHFAGYMLDHTPQMYFTYLMYKKNIGYRIGTSQVYTNGQRKKVVGFLQRSRQEHADALWIVQTHSTQNNARVAEYKLSLKYQIPTLPFVARKGVSKNGYVHDQNILTDIFESFDTAKNAKKLLKDHSLTLSEPHHLPQSRNSNRKNITVTLCGDNRGNTSMHRISMVGNSKTIKENLKKAGFSIRIAKKGSLSWRFETCNKDFGQIQSTIKNIKKAIGEVNVRYNARLGKNKRNVQNSNSLPFITASSLQKGMVLFLNDGNYDVIQKLERTPQDKVPVYDIDVKTTHNFIANNITTHNCIYTWRGAKVGNMLNFEKEFPNTKTVLLEENYRSTKTIIAASNRIIEKNNNRQEKNLFTNNPDGEKITSSSLYGELDEAYYITERVKELLKKGISQNEIAVLYRANFQSRILEEAFLDENIPYQVLGTRFFDRKEVKDVLSFIRLALNPESITDLTRIINVPVRGIGKTTLLRIVEGSEEECSPAMRQKIVDFKRMLVEIKKSLETKNASEAIKFIIEVTGIEQSLLTGKEEDTERLENIKELVTLAQKYDRLEEMSGMEKLMTDAALATDQDELTKKVDGVKLMTVHAAKGLEFDVVFITGLEEGLFPHQRMANASPSQGKGKVDDEEERRLFYVALTRARKKVYLTHTQVRTIFGSKQINIPSEFVTDIDDELIDDESLHTGEVREKTVYLDLDEL